MCLVGPQVRKHINDLYEDLRDGHNLISLLEVLSGDSLVSYSLNPQNVLTHPQQTYYESLVFLNGNINLILNLNLLT